MTIKVLTLLIASLFIISCNPNEIRKSYFENGAPESERSYKNGMLRYGIIPTETCNRKPLTGTICSTDHLYAGMKTANFSPKCISKIT
jgi:hypothetical protein